MSERTGLARPIVFREEVGRTNTISLSLLNRFFLRGDFNGDGKPDVAILVRNKESGKLGIAICHGGKNEIFVVGAGATIGNGGDDFSWMDVWQVYRGPSAQKARAPAKLIGEALQGEKSESRGGLICWDGKNASGSSTATESSRRQPASTAHALRTSRSLGSRIISANAC
jgi:hypothetical protein